MSDLRAQVEREAAEARRATARLTDAAVGAALVRAAALVRERRREILQANAEDCASAAALDEGTLDRLQLDDSRLERLASQVETMAAVQPLEREADSWVLGNGLRVSERRIPIGTVG